MSIRRPDRQGSWLSVDREPRPPMVTGRRRTCQGGVGPLPGSALRDVRKRRSPTYGVPAVPGSWPPCATTPARVPRSRRGPRAHRCPASGPPAASPPRAPLAGRPPVPRVEVLHRPSNSTATAASSYQASTRPTRPASSWISTCSSGRGRPAASMARRPRVSREATQPGHRQVERASRPPIPTRWPGEHRAMDVGTVDAEPVHGVVHGDDTGGQGPSRAQSTRVRGTDVVRSRPTGRSSSGRAARATR